LQTELLKSGMAVEKLVSAKNRESEIASGCDMLASRCNAINDRDSRFISKGLGRQEGSTGHADRYSEVGISSGNQALTRRAFRSTDSHTRAELLPDRMAFQLGARLRTIAEAALAL
jgi:hypothetical protein